MSTETSPEVIFYIYSIGSCMIAITGMLTKMIIFIQIDRNCMVCQAYLDQVKVSTWCKEAENHIDQNLKVDRDVNHANDKSKESPAV